MLAKQNVIARLLACGANEAIEYLYKKIVSTQKHYRVFYSMILMCSLLQILHTFGANEVTIKCCNSRVNRKFLISIVIVVTVGVLLK